MRPQRVLRHHQQPALAASVSGTSWPDGAGEQHHLFRARRREQQRVGSTSSATWSFTTEAGGTGGGSLFTEDFQSGGFTAGGWSRSSTNYVVIGSSYGNGGYGARLRRSSWLRTTFCPAGSTSLTVEFDRRALGHDSGEALTVTVVQGGVTKGAPPSPATPAALSIDGDRQQPEQRHHHPDLPPTRTAQRRVRVPGQITSW
ncbi:MAG: hypothetical protein R3E96_05565 [Planctomycetota bacterium]